MQVEPVSDAEFLSIAAAHSITLPLEQCPVWDGFDVLVGRKPWQRLCFSDDGQPVALISLTRYSGRGFHYYWAKQGPVWLQPQPPYDPEAEPTAAATERQLHTALQQYVRQADRRASFVRLHAWHSAPQLQDLLQSITYDQTVIVNLTEPEDARMAALSRSTRKKLRHTLADTAVEIHDETTAAAADFGPYHQILEQTALRDGFRAFGPEVYQQMVQALAGHARVFVARRTDHGRDGTQVPGRAVSWVMSVVNGERGTNYYSGQTAEGRATNIGIRLRWHIFNTLAAEGVKFYDLMGVDSPRVPELAGVGEFKRQFGPAVAVPGAWDLPLRPHHYRLLQTALAWKRKFS